jgi:hypothetical protein
MSRCGTNIQEFNNGQKRWTDVPGFQFPSLDGPKYTQDWFFYIEIWRDCPGSEDDAKVDSATFYQNIEVSPTPKSMAAPGFGMDMEREGQPWRIGATARVSPPQWQAQGK